jgi:hypothetical protein
LRERSRGRHTLGDHLIAVPDADPEMCEGSLQTGSPVREKVGEVTKYRGNRGGYVKESMHIGFVNQLGTT